LIRLCGDGAVSNEAKMGSFMHTPYELGFYKIPNFEMLVILFCVFGAKF
jgi:hypothetical protein